MTKERWCGHPVNKPVVCPKADAFLAELAALCAKHGVYISHEDGHGSFVLTADPNDTWVDEASVEPNMLDPKSK